MLCNQGFLPNPFSTFDECIKQTLNTNFSIFYFKTKERHLNFKVVLSPGGIDGQVVGGLIITFDDSWPNFSGIFHAYFI